MKLTVGKKLLIGFMSIALLLVLTNAISFYSIKMIDSSYSDLVDRRALVVKKSKEIQNLASREISGLRGILLDEADAVESFEKIVAQLDDLIEQTKELVKSQENIDDFEKMLALNKNFSEKSAQVINLLKTNNVAAKDMATKEVYPIAREIRDLSDQIGLNQQTRMEEESRTNSEMVKSVVLTVNIISISAVILAVMIGIVISRIISKPVEMMSQVASKIAEGDLTVERIKVKNRDEIGKLANAFNQMAENLRHLIQNVGSSSEVVASTSEELTASAEQTTSATNQIAASIQNVVSSAEAQGKKLEESARAMQEMSVGIQQVAESSSTVSEAAVTTMEEARKGNESLQRVIHQMNLIHDSVDHTANVVRRLEERSKEIDNITRVITEISNQTNLLALNAAIEAARAGEHGRGFAVVADEVRKLAEQCKESADQIATLIKVIKEDTNQAVEVMEKGTKETADGLVIVDEAKKGFERILLSIEKVAEETQEASAVAQQMSATVEEINASTEHIAALANETTGYTQTVAAASEEQLASMEEITASATALSQMAEELNLLIRKFKI